MPTWTFRTVGAVLGALFAAAGITELSFGQGGQSPDPDFVFDPAAGGGSSDRFGASIATLDGRVVIGSPGRPLTLDGVTNPAQGAVTVFREHGSGYTFEANLIVPDGRANDFLGTSVDCVNGWTVAGAPGVDVVVPGLQLPNQLQAGAVYVWQWNEPSWGLHSVLHHPSPRAIDQFGSTVAVHREALGDISVRHTIAAGAPTDDGVIPSGGTRADSGSVTVWDLQGGMWVQSAFIEMPILSGESYQSTAGALFGTSIRLEGPFMIIGAKRASPQATSQGAVYVFRRSTVEDPAPTILLANPAWGEWVLTQRIVAEVPGANDQFGTAIDAQQGCLAVGAPNRGTTAAPNTGAAYIYRRAPLTEQYAWESSLFPADAQPGDLFGAKVAVWGDTTAVGAPGVDVGTPPNQFPARGTVYTFATEGNECEEWTQRTEYAPPTEFAAPNAAFGSTVLLHTGQLIVGSPSALGPAGSQQGRSFSFPIDTIGCPWDLTGDGVTDGSDLALFLSHWGGTTPDHFVADYNGDFSVDGLDFTAILARWGVCGCYPSPAPPPPPTQ